MSVKLLRSRFENRQDYKDRVDEVVRLAEMGGNDKYVNWFQGYPVRHEFKQYLEELSLHLPHIRFLPASEKYDPDYRFTRFHVVMDGQLYTLGMVMYEDVTLGTANPATFVIQSRKIENKKYNPHRDQYRMVMPSFKNAVKQVKKYLLPYTVNELAFYTVDKYTDARGKFRRELETNVGKVTEALGFSAYSNPSSAATKKIIEELKHMLDTGYVPKTDWLTSALEQTHEAHQIIKEWTNYRPKISFVRIADKGEYPIVYELTPSDLTPARIQNAQPISYSSDDLPEELAGRIAVLQTLEDGQYVERVGLKYDSNTLWLEVEG